MLELFTISSEVTNFKDDLIMKSIKRLKTGYKTFNNLISFSVLNLLLRFSKASVILSLIIPTSKIAPAIAKTYSCKVE